MCERSARNWQSGPLPSQCKKERNWRTRVDPFAEVWEAEAVPLLVADTDGKLEATTVLDELSSLPATHPAPCQPTYVSASATTVAVTA